MTWTLNIFYVMMKGVSKYEESLNLCRILIMDDTEIMRIISSFVKGPAIDDQPYIERLTAGNKRLRTE